MNTRNRSPFLSPSPTKDSNYTQTHNTATGNSIKRWRKTYTQMKQGPRKRVIRQRWRAETAESRKKSKAAGAGRQRVIKSEAGNARSGAGRRPGIGRKGPPRRLHSQHLVSNRGRGNWRGPSAAAVVLAIQIAHRDGLGGGGFQGCLVLDSFRVQVFTSLCCKACGPISTAQEPLASPSARPAPPTSGQRALAAHLSLYGSMDQLDWTIRLAGSARRLGRVRLNRGLPLKWSRGFQALAQALRKAKLLCPPGNNINLA